MSPARLHSLSDRQLIEQVLGGNGSLFSELIRRTEKLAAQVVCRMIANQEDQKDLVQDIYLKVYRHLDGFRFNAKFSTWVAQIAYNTCIHHLEKKKLVLIDGRSLYDDPSPGLELADADVLADQWLHSRQLAVLLNKELDQLSPIFRTLLVLYHQQQLSYEEIAQVTSLPEGTVKNYLFRGRTALRKNIEQHFKREEL